MHRGCLPASIPGGEGGRRREQPLAERLILQGRQCPLQETLCVYFFKGTGSLLPWLGAASLLSYCPNGLAVSSGRKGLARPHTLLEAASVGDHPRWQLLSFCPWVAASSA